MRLERGVVDHQPLGNASVNREGGEDADKHAKRFQATKRLESVLYKP